MPNPRVTYLLATRNREQFLQKAFDNFREFIDPTLDEFIIIDGASTDKSLEIISQNRDLITKVISEPDQGEAHAFNKGLMIARGEIIKFLTDDDYFYPLAMKKAIVCMLTHPEMDAIICEGRHISQVDGNTIVRSIQHVSNNIDYFSLNAYKYANCGLGLFLRRRVISFVGLFDTTFTSLDGEYIDRLSGRKVNFKFYRVHVFDHLVQSDSSVVKNMWKVRQDMLRICFRNGMYGKLLNMWAGWNIRPLIPIPFRYVWKTSNQTFDEKEWDDGLLL
jgi:glycosyltransferase involved in cell wall biosynthesis